MEFRKFEMNDREFANLLKASKVRNGGGQRGRKPNPVFVWLNGLDWASIEETDMPVRLGGQTIIPGKGVTLDDHERNIRSNVSRFKREWCEANGYEKFPYFVTVLRDDSIGGVIVTATSYNPEVVPVD